MSELRPTDYIGAAIPLPVRVIGTRLKPFSLGHVLILERLGCSFVCGGIPTIGDLLLGVVVCSRDYNAALRAVDSWRATWHAKALGWRVRLSGVDLISCIRAFARYVEDGSKEPNFWKPKDKQQQFKRIAAPLPILVKVFLQSRLGYSEQEALNKPYGAALHEYAVALSMEGKLDLVDEVAAREIEAAKQPLTEAEIAALQKAANGV